MEFNRASEYRIGIKNKKMVGAKNEMAGFKRRIKNEEI